jgi:hypothetical protein
MNMLSSVRECVEKVNQNPLLIQILASCAFFRYVNDVSSEALNATEEDQEDS